jgi:non-canonical (house-cleaning) NTP pyrophosphatase
MQSHSVRTAGDAPDQPLSLTEGAQTALDRAMHSLGRLDGAATTMPDVDLLL